MNMLNTLTEDDIKVIQSILDNNRIVANLSKATILMPILYNNVECWIGNDNNGELIFKTR